MKAQTIEDLTPSLPLGLAARRIVAVRTAELYAFVPEALDEDAITAMHDMRIAAKRLRYLLELVGFCLGDVGGEAQQRARELQDALGEIHDSDVMLSRVAHDYDREPEGFAALTERFRGERSEQIARFHALWEEIIASGLRERLLAHTIPSPIDDAVRA
jgi:CHAD domain-containing protein